MSGLEILLTLVVAVGVAGVLVPALPGSLLIVLAGLVWAAEEGTRTSWGFFAVITALVVIGAVVKYLVPGRRLRASGVPTSTLLFGAALGIVGFFVVPVIGLPLGFVLGIYLAERRRGPHAQAWPATVSAVKAVGLGILIELGFALLAALAWVVAVVVT